MKCEHCGRDDVFRHDGSPRVHYRSITDHRPCPGSWPQPKKKEEQKQ